MQGRAALRIGFVLALVLLLAPAIARATPGTLSWSQPHDLAASVANPGNDAYGQADWRYAEAPAGTTDARTFTNLPAAYPSSGTPTGFQNSANGDYLSASSSSLTLQPGASEAVAAVLTAPVAGTYTIGYTLGGNAAPFPFGCSNTVTYSLLQNGTPLASGGVPHGSQTTGGPSSAPVLAAGDQIALVASSSGSYNANCATVNVSSFTLSTTAPAPAVTENAPSVDASGLASFSGTASAGFPYGSPTLAITDSAGAARPAPSVTQNGTSWSAASSTTLPPGTYTATVTQSDASGATSSASQTFTVPAPSSGGGGGGSGSGDATTPPTVTISSPGGALLGTGTPRFTGTAGTRPGDGDSVLVAFYRQGYGTARPYLLLSAKVNPDATFSVVPSSPLPDGFYGIYAGQFSSGGTGTSPAIFVRVKATPPQLTTTRPRSGARVSGRHVTLSGRAGTAYGDTGEVIVYLYSLAGFDGRLLGARMVHVYNGRWAIAWPGNLPYGLYTALATQTDRVGHTALQYTRFLIVPPRGKSHRSVRK